MNIDLGLVGKVKEEGGLLTKCILMSERRMWKTLEYFNLKLIQWAVLTSK
jgi:hypothetical protein